MLRPTIYRPSRLLRTDEPIRRTAASAEVPTTRRPVTEERPSEEPAGSSEPFPALAEMAVTA